MIYLNNEKLTQQTFPKQWEEYENFVTKLKTEFKNKPVTFKTRHPIRRNQTGVLESVKRSAISLESNIPGSLGSETWAYTEAPPRKDAAGNIIYNQHHLIIQGAIQIDPKEKPDLIFFLSEKSQDIKTGRIYLENLEAENMARIKSRSVQDEVRRMIESDYSPLSPYENNGDESILRDKAAAWGVQYAEDLGIYTLRLELEAAVEQSEQNKAITGMGYEEFIKEDALDEQVRIKSKIQKAIDTKRIIYDSEKGEWKFKNGVVLCTVPPNQMPNAQGYLRKFVSMKQDKLDLLMSEIEGLDGGSLKYAYSEDEIMQLNMSQLREGIKKFEPGYDFKWKSKEDLQKKLKEKIQK